MNYASATLLAACGLLAGALSAQAADLIIDEPLPQVQQPNHSNWYLRGDIGYAFGSHTDGDWNFWNIYAAPYRGIDDTFRYDRFSLNDGATFGAGFGYRFNETFRTDATLDFMRAGIHGKTSCPSYVKAGKGFNPVEDNCNYEDSSSADIWTTMANAYIDLPKLGMITPYMGFGVGAAYVSYDDWKTKEVCVGCEYQSNKGGLDSWRFAMSAMAGASYDINDQLKLDLGYRYLHVKGGKAYGYDAVDRATHTIYGDGPGATGTQARDNGFDIHTVRVGLRYELY